MKRQKKRTKKYAPKPVRPNDIFAEWAPQLTEDSRTRLGMQRAVAYREIMAGRGTLDQIAGIQTALEVAWALAPIFERKEEICELLVCASAEAQAIYALLAELKKPDWVEAWMGEALGHALDELEAMDTQATQAEYLRAIDFMWKHPNRLMSVHGAESAAGIYPDISKTWSKYLDRMILAYLHGRPVRGFLVERKGVLYFCASAAGVPPGPDVETTLIRVETPHVISLCERMTKDQLKAINDYRESEK